tara:strand:+ start:468 stop:617 length:150 start_codon:yes stop_codon:yes gene_type:complete
MDQVGMLQKSIIVALIFVIISVYHATRAGGMIHQLELKLPNGALMEMIL